MGEDAHNENQRPKEEMNQQVIKFRIRQDGTVEELVEGCTGPTCEILTSKIEEKLGDLSFRRETEEYYQQEQTNVALQHNQNQD